jgi:Transposase IS200 like
VLSHLAFLITPLSAETAGGRRFPVTKINNGYVELMAEWCNALEVEILAYWLMPNHVHLIAVPQSADGLGRAIGEEPWCKEICTPKTRGD